MNGGLTEEERLLQATAREFATREVAPTAIERDEAERYDRSLFTRMGELGLTAAPFPKSVGGAGFSYLGWTLVMEELGRRRHGHGGVAVGPHPVAVPVVTWGTPEQQARWLPAMLAGEALGAFALTEPHAGSDAAAIRTRAERVGPADAPTAYRLTGTKIWISNAPEADRYLVFATLDPARRRQGHHRVPRREGDARVPVRGARAEDGDPRLPGGGARVRRCRGPGREPARRGGRGLQDRAVGARRGPDLDRRGVRRDRPCRAGGLGSIPAAAQGVRRTACRAAGAPVHARRDGPRGRRRAGRDAGRRPRPRTAASRSPRRRRSPSGPPPTPRCASPPTPSSCSGRAATRARPGSSG